MLCVDDLFEMHTLGLYILIKKIHKDFVNCLKSFRHVLHILYYIYLVRIYRHNNLNVRTDNGQDPCSHGLN